MAYNTKSIIKDVNQKPIPQYYNPTSDVYEVLQGTNGANRVILYTEAGQAIDLVALITTIVTAINETGTTQIRAGTNKIGKVEVTDSALPTGAATSAKQDTSKSAIDAVATLLTSIKNTDGIKKIVGSLPAGTNNIGKVDVNTSMLPTGASTATKQDNIKIAIDNIYNQDKTVTLYGKSSETKPTSDRIKGDKYFEIDTGEAFMWDGLEWVVI